MADGVNEGLSSVEVLNRYRLVSSTNVVAVKRSLLDKNLIFTERKFPLHDKCIFKVFGDVVLSIYVFI